MESDKVFNFNKEPSTYSLFPRLKSTGHFFWGGGGRGLRRLHIIGSMLDKIKLMHFHKFFFMCGKALVTLFKRKQDHLYILHCDLLNYPE